MPSSQNNYRGRLGKIDHRSSSGQALDYQKLEPRQLLATLCAADSGGNSSDLVTPFVGPQVAADVTQAAAISAGESDAPVSPATPATQQTALNLPDGLPETFSVEVQYEGERLTLELEKNSAFGENTRFLIDDGSGNLVEVDYGVDRSYIGAVVGSPGSTVSALLTEAGLSANINRPNQETLIVEPVSADAGNRVHQVSTDEVALPHDHDGDGIPDHLPEDHGVADALATAASTGPTTATALGSVGAPEAELEESDGSSATLPPTRVVDVLEFEVGVEIGSAAFLNNYSGSTVAQKLVSAMAEVQKIPGNLDARYLHAAGIKHRLGTVIIRTSAAEDQFSVANGNDSAGLNAFRSYWNNNPGIVGNTHDLAVYHVRASPSGLAYVGTAGTSSAYALTASNGPSSWADGTLVHEFGHSWSLSHVNFDTTFYENRPRNNNGATSAGGIDFFISPMHGSGNHNIGRFATDEAQNIFNLRESRRSQGDLLTNPGQIKPFGHRDEVFIGGGNAVTIDVIANDYDFNNDVLDVQLLDTVSFQGASISLSAGTGPGGRNQLIYTPSGNGEDFFHYTVVDSTGRTDWGAVHVTVEGPVIVDTSQTEFIYDLGAPNSVLFNQSSDTYQRLSAGVTGDISFTGNASDFDRGTTLPGINAINRDGVLVSNSTTFSHKVANGTYAVTFNVGDADFTRDDINVSAEGQSFFTNIDRAPGEFNTLAFNVQVTDGEMNIVFDDLGGVNNDISITRIILRQTSQIVTVDTNRTEYFYDVGDVDSVIFNGSSDTYEPLSHIYTGDIEFVGGNPQSFDRGSTSGVNDINRDGVVVSVVTTLNHKLANGIWNVLVNIGDRDFARDNINVSAEGQTFVTNVDRAAAVFGPNLIFDVPVSDGQLNLTLVDTGGVNDDISMTRLILRRTGDLPAEGSVEGRYVFYNNSFHDGNDANAAASDDLAIATNKSALLPGQTATFSNYTSYDKGINGVIVDIDNLANASALSAADFVLATGNGNSLNDFTALTTAPVVSVRTGAGVGGSDRVSIILPDGLVTGTWLSVTALANENTGLAEADLFYFGNAIGDTGDSAANAQVTANDEMGARNNPRNFLNRAGVEFIYDFNRDSLVTSSDEIAARNNNTDSTNDLNLITAPSLPAPPAMASAFQPLMASVVTQPAVIAEETENTDLQKVAQQDPQVLLPVEAPEAPLSIAAFRPLEANENILELISVAVATLSHAESFTAETMPAEATMKIAAKPEKESGHGRTQKPLTVIDLDGVLQLSGNEDAQSRDIDDDQEMILYDKMFEDSDVLLEIFPPGFGLSDW